MTCTFYHSVPFATMWQIIIIYISDVGDGRLSRTDFCYQRFGTKETYTKMYALNQHMDTPGQVVYNSRKNLHCTFMININIPSIMFSNYLTLFDVHRWSTCWAEIQAIAWRSWKCVGPLPCILPHCAFGGTALQCAKQ